MATFQKVKFGDLIEQKIKVEIKKGFEYSFVPMENIEPGLKYPRIAETKVFNGSGSKFADGDTLFARITPCLQNKKIAKVKDLKNGVGFGSTEFFILRAKKDRANSDYVHYVARLDDLIDTAISSMVGASGRQRADIKSILEFEINVPDLPTQTRITSVLSTYDDLIENNEKRIKTLEEMASRLYTEWFVKFKFPSHEKVEMIDSGTEFGMIPEGWEVKSLSDEIELGYGKALKKEDRIPGKVLVCGSGGIVGTHNDKLVSGPGIVIGRKGNAGAVFWVNSDFYPIDTAFFVKTKLDLAFAFYLLKSQNFVLGDAAVPGLNRDQAYRNKILIPDSVLIEGFSKKAGPIRKLIGQIAAENFNLSQTLDLLIPQLVTGRRELK